MLKESDFNWLVRRVNNIPENQIDCYYCIVDIGDGTGKMYVVKPLYAQDAEGWSVPGEYKYFVFFDCSVRLATEKERKYPYSMMLYSGYCMTSETLIAVFDTMDVAQKRAYNQYAHHFGYVLPHVADDIEEKAQKHFVVK